MKSRFCNLTQIAVLKQAIFATPSSGIYYIVKLPQRWDIVYRRDDDWSDAPIEHDQYWRDEVSDYVATAYARVKIRVPALELAKYPYGFPRGRIDKSCRYKGEYIRGTLYHGGNMAPTGYSITTVLRLFGCKDVKDEVSPWEKCHDGDKEALRRLLRIKEDWDAVCS